MILSELAEGERAVSEIIAALSARSAGWVRLRPGSLFAALYRLRSERLIAIDREETVGERPLRYYRLTDAGRARLAEAAHRCSPQRYDNTDEGWIP